MTLWYWYILYYFIISYLYLNDIIPRWLAEIITMTPVAIP